MVAVRIDSGPPAAWMRPYEVEKSNWRRLMNAKTEFLKTNIPYDCRCLLEFVQDAEEMYEVLGFSSPSEMILKGYELDPEEVNLAFSWLEIVSPEDVVSYKDAVYMGRTLRDKPGAPEGNKNACKEKNNCHKVTIDSKDQLPRDNRADYLTARIKRDNPEIFEGLKNGDFKSVRQAAIAAGIIKVPNLYELAMKAYLRLPANKKKAFIEAITQLTVKP